ERLTAQLVEKDGTLQKWREERDTLVEALEVQLKTLASNNTQKDKEIAELKQAALKDSEKDKETDIEELRKQLAEKDDFIKELKQLLNSESLQSSTEVPDGQDKIDQSVNKEVSHMGVHKNKTVSCNPFRTKAEYMKLTQLCVFPEQKLKGDFVKSENKKNAKPAMTNSPSTSNKKMLFRKEYSLRKQESTSNKMSAKKKDGTLQKIGDFLQSSPTIIQSKAKKLIATISSPKPAEPEGVKENDLKPKRAKRKLYSTDISCPLEIPTSSVFIEQKEKESDHLIIKRRLRSKPAK
ncbi:KI20B protein, partial [Rhinoptilus africanus]|nr:KI20B protein [Rhinoptilus africanus]